MGVTVIELPVKPPVQFKLPPGQPVELRTTLPPKQIVVLLDIMVGVDGLDVTIIVTAVLESLLQPLTVHKAL